MAAIWTVTTWLNTWLWATAPLREIRAEHRSLKHEVGLLAAEIAKLKTTTPPTVTPTDLDAMPIDPHLGRM